MLVERKSKIYFIDEFVKKVKELNIDKDNCIFYTIEDAGIKNSGTIMITRDGIKYIDFFETEETPTIYDTLDNLISGIYGWGINEIEFELYNLNDMKIIYG